MKKACGLTLLSWLLSAIALMAIAYQRVPRIEMLILPCLGAGFVAMIGWAYLFGIPRVLRERASIRAGMEGEPLADGQITAAVGRVVALGTKIHSPFTNTPCVAYEYEIYRYVKNKTVMFKGFRVVPCAIQTRTQIVRLLAFPKLEFAPADLEGEMVRQAAKQYVAATPIREPTLENLRASFAGIKELMADDDGDYRSDDRHLPWDDSPNVRFSETVLAPGDEVSAIGRFSSQRGGFLPSKDTIHSIRVFKGPPEKALRKLAWTVFGYFIGAVVFLGAVVAGVIVFHKGVPPGSFG